MVIERAPDVIAVVREAAGSASWPGREKVTILQTDALGAEMAARVDTAMGGQRPGYVYADIWPSCGAADAPAETARMVRALCPQAAGWWGQELSFGLWYRDRDRGPDEAALRAYAGGTGVPIPITAGYAGFCQDVIAARLPPRRRPRLGQLWRRICRAKQS